LLCWVWQAELGEDLDVAGVGGRTVERHGAGARASHLLAEDAVLPVREPGTMLRVGEEEVPEPFGPGALANLHQARRVCHAGPDEIGVVRPLRLDRIDVLL